MSLSVVASVTSTLKVNIHLYSPQMIDKQKIQFD